MDRDTRLKRLNTLISREILVLDGATGTVLQGYNLSEEQFRGDTYGHLPGDQKGNYELLNLTRFDLIRDVHLDYLAAGARIIETNTFNANAISQERYGLSSKVYELNRRGALAAREAADMFSDRRWAFVAGVLGPTGKTASVSPRMEDPGFRDIHFSDLKAACYEQARGLLDGGVDLFLVETVFDSLNAKAALQAITCLMEQRKIHIPVMVSATINDTAGRLLTGQSMQAFFQTIAPFSLFAAGLNCSFGARSMTPFIKELSNTSPYLVSAHPNAGLPNDLGEYDQTPEIMAKELELYCRQGLVNIVGGCCGSTPQHIEAISNVAKKYPPRTPPKPKRGTVVTGLDTLEINHSSIILVGERTNVTGSKIFREFIRKNQLEKALDIAKEQLEKGAKILNINMDEAMINGKKTMVEFLRLLTSDPYINKHPLMLDSSHFPTLEAGLQNVIGKPIINSISLKEGEESFLQQAQTIKNYGAAVMVMAFDEKGQADTFERKIQICERSWNLLTKSLNFPPEDIIFDPNVLAIGTGIKEHNSYAADFVRAVKWIKENIPHSKTSAGVSNVSFAFRGNHYIRHVVNTVFIRLCDEAGLDMAIVNPGKIVKKSNVPRHIWDAAENLLMNRGEVDKMLDLLLNTGEKYAPPAVKKSAEKKLRELTDPEERLTKAVIQGENRYLEQDLNALQHKYKNALHIIEGPLMKGMRTAGNKLETGEMFLPQVVKSARTMKKAVQLLAPHLTDNTHEKQQQKKKMVLATVKGDVHDIGKNILSMVLSCHDIEIIDLGIMVDNRDIIRSIKEHKPHIVGVSGLITPSLNHMKDLATQMESEGMHIPLILGGAATTAVHTAVRVAPFYSGPVAHGKDASHSMQLIAALTGENKKQAIIALRKEQRSMRKEYKEKQARTPYYPLTIAREKAFRADFTRHKPFKPALVTRGNVLSYSIDELAEGINWKMFLGSWGFYGKFPLLLEEDSKKGAEARRLYEEAREVLEEMIAKKVARASAIAGIFPAAAVGDDILIYADDSRQQVEQVLPMLRQQKTLPGEKSFLCLSDFIAPKSSGIKDYLGMFAASAGFGVDHYAEKIKKQGDSYKSIMIRLLADRMTEALSEKLHNDVKDQLWGYNQQQNGGGAELMKQPHDGIRPSPGYPTCPDHSLKKHIFKLMDVEKHLGIKLTSSYAMNPASSVCGFYFALPQARYFNLGKISRDQVADYVNRQKIPLEKAENLFKPFLNYKTNKNK